MDLEKAGERDSGMVEAVPLEEPKLEKLEESGRWPQLELQAENQDQQLEQA